MLRALICSSSGLCDYIVELQHWPFRYWFAVCWEFGCDSAGVVSRLPAEACWSLGAVRLGWYPGCRLKLVGVWVRFGWGGIRVAG